MQQELPRRDDRTGLDLPNADGQVSDEDVTGRDKPATGQGGQDHSLEHYSDAQPNSGIGAEQDRSDTQSDIAPIADNR